MNSIEEAENYFDDDPFLSSLGDSEREALLSVNRIEFDNTILEMLYNHAVPSSYPEAFLPKFKELGFDASSSHILSDLDWSNTDSFQENIGLKNELLAVYHISRSLGLHGWEYRYVEPLRPWQAIHVHASWLVFSLAALDELKNYSANRNFDVLDNPFEKGGVSDDINVGIEDFLKRFNVSAEEYARALYVFFFGDYTSPLVQVEGFQENYLDKFSSLPMFPKSISEALIISGYSASVLVDYNDDQVKFEIVQASDHEDKFDDLWIGKTDYSHD